MKLELNSFVHNKVRNGHTSYQSIDLMYIYTKNKLLREQHNATPMTWYEKNMLLEDSMSNVDFNVNNCYGCFYVPFSFTFFLLVSHFDFWNYQQVASNLNIKNTRSIVVFCLYIKNNNFKTCIFKIVKEKLHKKN
jgi:sensor histidine kinase YesM